MSKKLLKRVKISKSTKGKILLHRTQKLEEFDEEEREVLEFMYSSNDEEYINFASILNSVLTQERSIFILSRNRMFALIMSDPNNKNKKLTNSAYKNLLFTILSNDFFVRVREPKGSKAGLYEVKDPEIMNLLKKRVDMPYLIEQKEVTKKWYDESSNGVDDFDISKSIKNVKQKIKMKKMNDGK